MVPDLVLGALAKALPGQVLAEGAAALWNIHMSVRPTGPQGRRAEILMFNSGGMGARPGLDLSEHGPGHPAAPRLRRDRHGRQRDYRFERLEEGGRGHLQDHGRQQLQRRNHGRRRHA